MVVFLVYNDIVAIGIGAFIGAISRYQIGRVASEYIKTQSIQYPHLSSYYQKYQRWHTSAINIGGSFLLGGIVASPSTTAAVTAAATQPPPPTTTTTATTVAPPPPASSSSSSSIGAIVKRATKFPSKSFLQQHHQQPMGMPPSVADISNQRFGYFKNSIFGGTGTNGSSASIFGSNGGWLNSNGLSPRTKLLLGVGFCGSFTTFSTYSVDVVHWIQVGQPKTALAYIAINNIGGITAAALGMMIVKRISFK